MMSNDEWLIWQLADSAFPAGGLAHSNGLEAALQHGLVTDGASVEQFVRAGLRQCARGVLQFVRETWQHPDDFNSCDRHCDLFLNNHVTNRASRAQGRAMLAATGRIFATESILRLTETTRRSQSAAHLAPVFGVVLGSLGIGQTQTQTLFLFLFIRSTLGSAVRLGIIGPLEAQRIQSVIRPSSDFDSDVPVQTAPVLDLLQGTQDRLYSRLFQS
jgi:urease accessory protein